MLLVSLIANNRRADFVALGVAALAAWGLIFIVRPKARRSLVISLLLFLALGGAYVGAFYKVSGVFAEPARSVVSVFYPDATEAASNLYRDIENYDLKYTVQLNPLGLGFGKPFLEPRLLPDISGIDPVYLFIPHNTIWWVWMRLGAAGYFMLWYLFGVILVRGCMYVRQVKEKYLQSTAIYIVGMVMIEIMVAYADYQLSFYRNVIYIGLLLGILMKLPALARKEEKKIDEVARAHAELPLAHVGSGQA
jgi:hypothetical protein